MKTNVHKIICYIHPWEATDDSAIFIQIRHVNQSQVISAQAKIMQVIKELA